MSRFLLSVLVFFCSCALFAENNIGIIQCSGDFTFVRNGQGNDFPIVDTLHNGDFLYINNYNKSEWVKVSTWQGKQIEGFINKNSCKLIENLDKQQQKDIILNILNQNILLANKLNHAMKTNDSLDIIKLGSENADFNERKYELIIEFLPKYFCATNDTEIIGLFFANMWANKGSASETPAFSIGESYICNPNLIIEQVLKIDNKEQKLLICENIEWGILNHFKVGEEGKSDNKEFNKLMNLLEDARKK